MVAEPGQRWRSVVDGHTVVTHERTGDGLWIRFDASSVTTVIDNREFIDDYEFVAVVEESVLD
jgi:hypothetical protein